MIKIVLLFCSLLFQTITFSQAHYPDTILVCSGDTQINIIGTYPTNLNIDFSVGNSTSISSLTDDVHTGLIPIGFSFDFYGTTYTDVVASTNGYLSFNSALANTFSPWSISGSSPANAATFNSIMGVYTDVLPTTATQEIDISLYGVAPNRVFIITWDNIPMFSCIGQCYYSSILLFEGTNEIVNTVGQIETCSSWNGGVAVQGLVDATGSANSLVTDDAISGIARDFPNTFTSSGDAVRYTPNASGTSYTYQFIAYNPVGLPSWYDVNGVLLGQGYSLPITLPPFDSLPYKIKGINVMCDQIWEDSILVVEGIPDETIIPKFISCFGDTDGKITYTCEGGENKDWTIILKDANGVVVDQYIGDNMPVVFSNLPYGIYHISTISPTTCFNTTELLIAIDYSVPKVHADITDVACHGDNSGQISFNPHGGFNEGWDVEVYDQAGILVNNYNSDIIPINVIGLKAGDYSIVVKSPTTCEDTIDYVITQPDPFYFETEDYGHNNCGTLSSYINFPVAGGIPPYKYKLDGKFTLDLNRTPLTNEVHNLVAIDANGCELIRDIDIQDRFEPKVDFNMPLEVNLEDGIVNFEDLTEVNPHTTIESWFWEFGDFAVSYEQHPTHIYTEIGIYKVFLFVTDANGCQGFLEREINVISPALYLPTAFTPNGDGDNETFKPLIFRVSNVDYKMSISDRWGRLLFETNNIHEGWDGRDKNGNVMTGSYVWIINYTDAFGYEKREDGLVVLIK